MADQTGRLARQAVERGECRIELDDAGLRAVAGGRTRRFKCPHGIAFDPEGRLWIADRGNHRMVMMDADGRALEHSDDVCPSPCMFAFHGGLAYCPQLCGGIILLSPELTVVADVGGDPQIEKIPQDQSAKPMFWPDQPRSRLSPGLFNSPHGLAVTHDGSVIVCEWIIGGRVTKLKAMV